MARSITEIGNEESLAVRAAWLHYVGGLTQADVANRLGVPKVKAHRLIARAVADGVVNVSIDGVGAECALLENEICERFGLDFCTVAPDVGEPGLPLRAISVAAANYLYRELERGDHRVVGLSHGRTLAAMARQLPRMEAHGVRFVALLGGLTRDFAANPHDVMHVLAEKTGAPAYLIPVPFFANSAEDREVLLAQQGVRQIFEMSNSATLKIVGVGTLEPDAQLVTSGMMEPKEIKQIKADGGVGEMLGHFFDVQGRLIQTSVTSRTLGISLEANQGAIVAIAGGPGKVGAVRAVLASGRLKGMVTDEATARALLAGHDR